MFVVIGHVDDDLILNHFVDEAGSVDQMIVNGSLKRADVTTFEELAVFCGIWPSKSQARKNGLSGEIPFGISRTGSKKKKIWVWRSPLHSSWKGFTLLQAELSSILVSQT